MTIAELLLNYQQLGLAGILLTVVLFFGQHLLKQNKNFYESHQEQVRLHKKEIKEMNARLLEVMEENSRANTCLAKAIEHLHIRLEGIGR